MAQITDNFDLGRLRLTSGEGRRLAVDVVIGTFEYGGATYGTEPGQLHATLDVARTTHGGYSLRLRYKARVSGPCVRCLEPAGTVVSVDAREIDQPGGGDELRSPYVDGDDLDLRAWTRDAFALALPVQILCREDCKGLCPVCGVDLNAAEPGHAHERAPDPRWAKLAELRFDT